MRFRVNIILIKYVFRINFKIIFDNGSNFKRIDFRVKNFADKKYFQIITVPNICDFKKNIFQIFTFKSNIFLQNIAFFSNCLWYIAMMTETYYNYLNTQLVKSSVAVVINILTRGIK